MFDYKQLSFLLGTQTRGRTGMDCSTGVWDQRVYRFRHLGLASAKVHIFFEQAKDFVKKLMTKRFWAVCIVAVGELSMIAIKLTMIVAKLNTDRFA